MQPTDMWKPRPSAAPVPRATPVPEPVRSIPTPPPVEPVTRPRAVAAPIEHATLGKGLVVRGEISGTDSLVIDGRVEGSISLPGERVMIGVSGHVTSGKSAGAAACIAAREIVVVGKVNGNIAASDRVEIRAEGSLSGDVSTARISIADGAQFRGGIDIRTPEAKPVNGTAPGNGSAAKQTPPVEAPKPL